MRKNLTRIASLVLACVLFSVPAFAELTGSYLDGTFTVSGGATGLQTSLIIVKDSHTTLPVADEAVTGAIYIDQVEAAENGAAFTGVALDSNYDVHTAFFSNESENSASSFKIVNATLEIAVEDQTNVTVEEDQEVIISVTKSRSVDTVAFKVGGVETPLTYKDGGYAFTPATAGTYTIVATATVEGEEITSNAITITATEVEEILTPVTIEGINVLGEVAYDNYNNYAAQGVAIKIPFGENGKMINKMKWVFETATDFYYSSEKINIGLAASGDMVFTAVVKNGDVEDGEIVDDSGIEITKVGAIFDVDGLDYYTNEAYGRHKAGAEVTE